MPASVGKGPLSALAAVACSAVKLVWLLELGRRADGAPVLQSNVCLVPAAQRRSLLLACVLSGRYEMMEKKE